jgi:hypothetical protein
MPELVFGSGSPHLLSFIKQHPVQMLSAVVAAVSLAMTLVLGVRGAGSGDPGGGFDNGDGGSCGD